MKVMKSYPNYPSIFYNSVLASKQRLKKIYVTKVIGISPDI